MSEQFYPAKQQVDQIAVEDAVVVIKIVLHIHANDNLFEEILGKHQRCQFGKFLFIGIHAETYYFNIFQIGIPAVLSVYFDLFSGAIQSYVFIMLTMIYIQMGRE